MSITGVHAVMPSGARGRIRLARRALALWLQPLGLRPFTPNRSNRVSYNIVPQKSWLTESRTLRILPKTEAIRSEHLQFLRFACATTTWRSHRILVPAFRTQPVFVAIRHCRGCVRLKKLPEAHATKGGREVSASNPRAAAWA